VTLQEVSYGRLIVDDEQAIVEARHGYTAFRLSCCPDGNPGSAAGGSLPNKASRERETFLCPEKLVNLLH
jgi:hypothetical protein